MGSRLGIETEDPLIKSESTDPRKTTHHEASARDSEGW
jgi:hypothetical protein